MHAEEETNTSASVADMDNASKCYGANTTCSRNNANNHAYLNSVGSRSGGVRERPVQCGRRVGIEDRVRHVDRFCILCSCCPVRPRLGLHTCATRAGGKTDPRSEGKVAQAKFGPGA